MTIVHSLIVVFSQVASMQEGIAVADMIAQNIRKDSTLSHLYMKKIAGSRYSMEQIKEAVAVLRALSPSIKEEEALAAEREKSKAKKTKKTHDKSSEKHQIESYSVSFFFVVSSSVLPSHL
jgi:hypothetical protein